MFAVDMEQRRRRLIPDSEVPEIFNATLRADLNGYHHHHHQQHQQFLGSNHGQNSVSRDSEQGYVSSHPSSSDIRGTEMDPRFGENSGIFSKEKYALADHFGRGNNVVNSRDQVQGYFPQVESSMRNAGAPGMITMQMEAPFGHHHYRHHSYGQMYHGNYLPRAWAQYGVNPGDTVHSTWHYPMIPCFPGRDLNASSSEIPFYNQCQQPVSAILQNPNPHYLGVQTAYGFPLPVNNILHPVGIHADPLLRNSRPFPLSSSMRSNRSYRPPPQSTPSSNSVGELNDTESLRSYGADHFFDRHSDMRLDVDNMSYEELLALGERIGKVKTGLSREDIFNHVKTRACHLPEKGSCVVCQEEYSENEKIGTLICGHEYHEDCIKEWLLVKNLCPICKQAAVPKDEREI